MVTRLVSASLALLLGINGTAQEHEHGSRQKLGAVHFSTSCDPAAQPEFDRAVALLHSFQFSGAIDGFNSALKVDRSCGISYWGIALSQWSNPFAAGSKDPTQLNAGHESAEHGIAVGAKSDRERAYIAAAAKLYDNFDTAPQHERQTSYRDAMQKIATSYPEDHEAQIFYALSLASSEELSDKTYAARLKAGAILEKLFAQAPDHPGLAHYIIHTYDIPTLAARALPAARRYAAIAPDAPHALHMPSHTFTRTGDWQASIESNVAAAAAARRERQTAEELHASDYLMYAYLQSGQDAAAKRLLSSLPEITSRFDPKAVIGGAGGPSAGYFALAAIPARYALERQQWKDAVLLPPHETPFPYAEAMTWFARGLGAARLGQMFAAHESSAALRDIQKSLADKNENYWARQVQIQQIELIAWLAFAEGSKDEALRQIESASELEDQTEKSAVSPGPLAPAHELMGEILLQMNQPERALAQFQETLKNEPSRFRSLYGAARAAQISGDRAASQKYFQQLLTSCERSDDPRRTELIEARAALSQN